MLRSMKDNGRGLPGILVRLVALIGLLAPRVAAASGATAVVAGARRTCAVTNGGALWCWGWNVYGGLGDGTTTDRLTPVMVSGLTSGGVAAAAGPYHTCAVTSGGALLCWGGNQYGQLGDGTTTNRLTPVPVSGLTSGVVAVTAGYYHTCALTSGGAVQCLGANYSGRLGDGTTTNRLTPVAVSGLTSGVVATAAGAHHTCAVTSGGAVQCWGNNPNGQLGDGTTTNRSVPGPVSGLGSGIAAVTAGEAHTCALTSTGGVVCWGGNFAGQVGDGTTTARVTATPVTGLQSGVRAITAGQWHTCALTIAE